MNASTLIRVAVFLFVSVLIVLMVGVGNAGQRACASPLQIIKVQIEALAVPVDVWSAMKPSDSKEAPADIAKLRSSGYPVLAMPYITTTDGAPGTITINSQTPDLSQTHTQTCSVTSRVNPDHTINISASVTIKHTYSHKSGGASHSSSSNSSVSASFDAKDGETRILGSLSSTNNAKLVNVYLISAHVLAGN